MCGSGTRHTASAMQATALRLRPVVKCIMHDTARSPKRCSLNMQPSPSGPRFPSPFSPPTPPPRPFSRDAPLPLPFRVPPLAPCCGTSKWRKPERRNRCDRHPRLHPSRGTVYTPLPDSPVLQYLLRRKKEWSEARRSEGKRDKRLARRSTSLSSGCGR